MLFESLDRVVIYKPAAWEVHDGNKRLQLRFWLQDLQGSAAILQVRWLRRVASIYIPHIVPSFMFSVAAHGIPGIPVRSYYTQQSLESLPN